MSANVEMTSPPAANGGADIETGLAANPNIPPEPEIGKGFLKPIPETTPVERVAAVVAGAAVLTALIAMIVEGGTLVLVGGILSAVVGPYAYYQQTLLTDIRTLTETKEALQAEVDRLAFENGRLAKSVDDMSTSVDHLEDIEKALETITSMQGQSVDEFAGQVEKSKTILAGMQNNLKANVLQNLLSVILRSDKDGDMVIQEAEIADALRRIKNISGVTIHEDRFREMCVDQPVTAVMDVAKNLLNEDVPEDERIFDLAQ